MHMLISKWWMALHTANCRKTIHLRFSFSSLNFTFVQCFFFLFLLLFGFVFVLFSFQIYYFRSKNKNVLLFSIRSMCNSKFRCSRFHSIFSCSFWRSWERELIILLFRFKLQIYKHRYYSVPVYLDTKYEFRQKQTSISIDELNRIVFGQMVWSLINLTKTGANK